MERRSGLPRSNAERQIIILADYLERSQAKIGRIAMNLLIYEIVTPIWRWAGKPLVFLDVSARDHLILRAIQFKYFKMHQFLAYAALSGTGNTQCFISGVSIIMDYHIRGALATRDT